MSKQLPERPNLDHLRSQAKDLLKAFRRGDPSSVIRFAQFLPAPGRQERELLSLHDAQLVVAREYGFESWPKLVAHVEQVRAAEGITEEIANRFVDLALSGGNAARLLELYPALDRHSPAAALVSGNAEYLQHRLSSLRAKSSGGLARGESGATAERHRTKPLPRWERSVRNEPGEGARAGADSPLSGATDAATYSLMGSDIGGSHEVGPSSATPSRDRNDESDASSGSALTPYPPLGGRVGELLERSEIPYEGRSHDIGTNRGGGSTQAPENPFRGESSPLPPKNWTALEYVCYSRFPNPAGLTACAKLLLESGADPNAFHTDPRWPDAPLACLYGAACEAKNFELTKLLLEHGANPNDGESVYHAAQQGLIDTLELLKQHKADISSSHPHWQNTPVYFLAGHRGSDAHVDQANLGAKWLLENGSDPNIECGSCHETALIAAVRNGNTELVKLLLKHGADPNVVNDNGMRPYFLARALGLTEAAALLEQAGAEPQFDELAAAVGEGNLGRVRQLLSERSQYPPSLVELAKSRDLGTRSGGEGGRGERSSELALLVKLAELGNTKGVQAALAAGIPVDATGEAGATALHFACYRGWADTVDLLLRHSPPLEARDCNYNSTPLGWALEGMLYNPNPQGDYIRAVKALLKAGASDENLKERLETDETEMPAMRELLKAIENS